MEKLIVASDPIEIWLCNTKINSPKGKRKMSKGGNVISAVGPRLGFQAKPPERGSFPIDHDGECKDFQKLFMKCLKEAGGDNGKCRIQSMNYLDCRMKKKLMQQETWKNLGYADIAVKET